MPKKKKSKELTYEEKLKFAADKLDKEDELFIKDIKSDESFESCMNKVKDFSDVWHQRGAWDELQRIIDTMEAMGRRDLVLEIAEVMRKYDEKHNQSKVLQ